MTAGEPVPLVPGELRGYRRFLVLEDGLYPVVHRAAGRWEAGRHVARCSEGGEHDVPARDCTCGLYAWYEPRTNSGEEGSAFAVVAASGRIVLGDRGFRAARARVEAVAFTLSLRCTPSTAARARQMLAERYPDARVYRSARAMWREHPPHDVAELGIGPIDHYERRIRRIAYALWAAIVLAGYAVLLLRREPIADTLATWWLVWLMAGLVGWLWTLVVLGVLIQPKGDAFAGSAEASGSTLADPSGLPGGDDSAGPRPD